MSCLDLVQLLQRHLICVHDENLARDDRLRFFLLKQIFSPIHNCIGQQLARKVERSLVHRGAQRESNDVEAVDARSTRLETEVLVQTHDVDVVSEGLDLSDEVESIPLEVHV